MKIELRGLDLKNKKAIAFAGGRWLELLRHRNWQPLGLGGEERALALLRTQSMVRKSRFCESFEELASLLERACAAVNEEQALRILSEPSGGRARAAWGTKLEDPALSAGLHWFFIDRGCTEEEADRLSLLVLKRLYAMGPVAERQVLPSAFELARDLCPARTKAKAGAPRSRADIHRQARLLRILRPLPLETRQCLFLWSCPQHTVEEIASMMNREPAEVERRLSLTAMRLGRTVADLRSAEVQEAAAAAVGRGHA